MLIDAVTERVWGKTRFGHGYFLFYIVVVVVVVVMGVFMKMSREKSTIGRANFFLSWMLIIDKQMNELLMKEKIAILGLVDLCFAVVNIL